MAAYRQVCDSLHLQADYQEPGSAPEPYVRQSSIGYLNFFVLLIIYFISEKNNLWCTCPLHLKMHRTNLWSTKPFFIWLKVCTVLAFSVLSFSSICVFSAPGATYMVGPKNRPITDKVIVRNPGCTLLSDTVLFLTWLLDHFWPLTVCLSRLVGFVVCWCTRQRWTYRCVFRWHMKQPFKWAHVEVSFMVLHRESKNKTPNS